MMKLSSFDSMSITPTSKDVHNQGNHPIFIREFVAMFDEELNPVFEKKRRLSVNQVKELEKNFEVDNKLDPERKMKLAHEVGLHPRQVSVWFQNRRARWKTKQLERDYFILKSNYDSLKNAMEKLHHENQAFLKEIEELKSTLNENGEQTKIQEMKEQVTEDKIKLDDTLVSCFFPSHSCFQLADEEGEQEAERIYGYVERHFFGEENSCSSLFSVDQAPTLQWYHSTDDWTLSGK